MARPQYNQSLYEVIFSLPGQHKSPKKEIYKVEKSLPMMKKSKKKDIGFPHPHGQTTIESEPS